MDAARRAAIERFRNERLDEPLEKYLDEFDKWQGVFEDLMESLIDLSEITSISDAMRIETLSDLEMQIAFRYLAGPPISKDDLKTIADVKS
ncbi:MAG: hypothetical protein MJE77_35390 [Proteobacteria bacterium]|nr:hypothetical protein [Pseudomonadota bacterium]